MTVLLHPLYDLGILQKVQECAEDGDVELLQDQMWVCVIYFARVDIV